MLRPTVIQRLTRLFDGKPQSRNSFGRIPGCRRIGSSREEESLMKRRALLIWIGIVFALSNAQAQAPAAINLTGKWALQVETSAGTGTPTLELKQDGEKLTGHYTGQLGEADLTGTVKGQTFNFNFTGSIQGLTLNVTYNGTMENK